EDQDQENDDNGKDKTALMPTGRIVSILERNWRDYVASIAQDDEDYTRDRILVTPYDPRIPRIRIFTKQGASLKDQRLVVRIDSWETGSNYPNGHLVGRMGKVGDPETEIQVLLVENDITIRQFS